ncbi:MAG: uroporphyrinogen-III synthase [Lachnospiraceae bacterium]
MKFAVIGTGTAKELEKHGFYADLMPEVFDAAHLGAALAKVCSHARALDSRAQPSAAGALRRAGTSEGGGRAGG